MNRRKYITKATSCIALTAGCLTSSQDSDSVENTKNNTDKNNTMTEYYPDNANRIVNLLQTRSEGISLSSSIEQKYVTSQETAKLNITWDNNGGDLTTISVGRGKASEPLFSHRYKNEEWEPTGLVLVPTHYQLDWSGPCWKPPEGKNFGGNGAPDQTNLEPGESFSNTYNVWTNPREEGCVPSGEYDFGHFNGSNLQWRVTIEVVNIETNS